MRALQAPKKVQPGAQSDNFVTRLAFSSDGTMLIARDLAGSVRFWDVATGKAWGTLPSRWPVEPIAVSSDGKYLATGVYDPYGGPRGDRVLLWNFGTVVSAIRPR